VKVTGHTAVAGGGRSFSGDTEAAATLDPGRHGDLHGDAAARTDRTLGAQRGLGERYGQMSDDVRASALTMAGATAPLGRRPAAGTTEQAGEDVRDVEVTVEFHAPCGGARAAEGARERVRVEPFGE